MVIDHSFVRVSSVIEVQVQHDGVVLVLRVDVHAVDPHGLAVHQDGHFAVLFTAFTENVLDIINNVTLHRLLWGWRGVGPLVVMRDDVGPGTSYHGMRSPRRSLGHYTNLLTWPEDS